MTTLSLICKRGPSLTTQFFSAPDAALHFVDSEAATGMCPAHFMHCPDYWAHPRPENTKLPSKPDLP